MLSCVLLQFVKSVEGRFVTEVEGELRKRVECCLCWHLSCTLFLWKEAQRGRERGKWDEIK